MLTWAPPAHSFYTDAKAPNQQLLIVRGTGADGYTDDTDTFTTADGLVWHASAYQRLDLRPYGVPATATAAVIGVKGIITKGSTDSAASTWVFVRAPGAACCTGPPGHELTPVDANEGAPVRGLIIQSVAQLAGDGRRDIGEATVPIRRGFLEWAWGYQRADNGPWPAGDAAAVNLYLTGWYR